MNITVILCTYNRCQSLSRALESVAVSLLPASVEWEVLVVDNNSSDQTREVVDNFSSKYPNRFRYMFEAKQGKSHALNAGIRAARGDLLAFMDDDVTVDPKWLTNLAAPLNEGTWAGAGGRILPEQTSVLPNWLTLEGRYVLGPLVIFDLGPKRAQLTEAPFGTNMAYQKKLFEKYGGFRTDLGPQPDSEIRGEDSEFGFRLLAEGERLCYEPSAVVYHSIPENRLRKEYFLAWWFDKGRSEFLTAGVSPETKWFVAGIPLIWFRRLAMGTLRWMVASGASQRFSARLNISFFAGLITESYRQQHDGAKLKSNQAKTHKDKGEVATLTMDLVKKKEI